ncbi:MAG: glycosyltransferase [Balneolaceae bacterium]|nr:glycosyltransferase [Balneolaceae bacterium]
MCPNAIKVPEENFVPDEGIKEKYGIPKDATVFLFSGNLGKGHGLDFLIESIQRLEEYEKAFFLIGGAGTHFNKIKSAFSISKPKNAYLYSYLPEKEFEQILGICDVGLILLDSCYSYPQFPSRLLAYLKSKMAVLCAVNKKTDIGDIVEAADAGLSTVHGNFKEFEKAVTTLSENKNQTKSMGKNAYQLLLEKYSVEDAYKVIMKHFE